MGRFFKAQPVELNRDFIYTPPVELMAKVIGNADTQIKENETALLSLYDKLQAESLKQDEPRLKEIITGYQSQIEGMASKIQEDPLAFRKEMAKIRQLGRDINNDWTKGEVSAIQGNKFARDKWVKDHLEKAKREKGYVTQDDMTFAQTQADQMFKGTDYKGPGDYKQWSQENLNAFVNLEDISEDRAKGYIADVVTRHGAYTDGKYMYTSENKKEVVPFDTIKKGVLTSMLNDRELMAYYGQQVRLGRFTQDDVAAKLQDAANRVAEKYSYSKVESGRKSITGDPFALKAMDFENQWKLKMADWGREDKKEIAGPSIDANIRTGEQLDILNKNFSASLFNLAGKLGVKSTREDGRITPQDVRTKIQSLNKMATTPAQKKAIQNYYNTLNDITAQYNSGQVKASWSGFASVYGTDVAVAARKQFEAYTKDPRNLYDKKMDYKVNGKLYRNITLYDVYNSPQKYGLKPDAFVKTDEYGETVKRDIKEIFVHGSQVPVMVSDRKEDWQYNDMLFEFEGDDMNIEGQTSFGELGIDYVK